jgi:hypothetical protein
MMRFYSGQHRFYCGVDLHTRSPSLRVIDSAGAIVRWERRPKRSEARRSHASLRFGLSCRGLADHHPARLD